MRVTLDVGKMCGTMELWRHVLAQPDERGAGHRAASIAGVRNTVAGWSDLLRLCSVDAAEQEQLDSIRVQVAAFLDWLREADLAITLLNNGHATGTPLPRSNSCGRRTSRQ